MEVNTIKEARELIKSGTDISNYDCDKLIDDCYDQLTYNTNCSPINYNGLSMYVQLGKNFKVYVSHKTKHNVILTIILNVDYNIYDYDPINFDFGFDNSGYTQMSIDYSVAEERFAAPEHFGMNYIDQDVINCISRVIEDKLEMKVS